MHKVFRAYIDIIFIMYAFFISVRLFLRLPYALDTKKNQLKVFEKMYTQSLMIKIDYVRTTPICRC